MRRIEKLLVFTLSDLRCALRLSDVERILHAVEINPVPKAPEIVMGLINVRGSIIPVLNIRGLFHLPAAETTLHDQIIIARTSSRPVAILVNDVIAVSEFGEESIMAPEELYPGIEYLKGITRLKDDIVYIYDLDTFLSSEDEVKIEQLLAESVPMPTGGEMEKNA